MTLNEFFSDHPKAALAFSGGVDSAYLLSAAKACGADVRPYFIKTPFQPAFELADAKALSPDLQVLDLDVTALAQVTGNPPDRCYHCKKAMFGLLRQKALEDGYYVLLDGTNASDDFSDRPGVRALQEYGVLSPLRMCGLTKEEIRSRSKELGLFTWNKPAYACLATRIPTGTAIAPQMLIRIEQAEQALMDLGYRDFRVRVFHDAARIQLNQDQFPVTTEQYHNLLQAVRPHFETVLLDLAGR